MSELADKAIAFIQCLNLTEDYSNDLFILRPWQEEIIRGIFKEDANGNRIINEVFLMLPKKNAKTTILSALSLVCLLALGKSGQQIVMAASSREQASIMYDKCCQMIRSNETLSGMLEIYKSKKRIIYAAKNSSIVAISADAGTAHGLNPSVCLIDEVHAHKNKDLWGVLRKSMGTRKERLWISITHAGFDKASLAFEQFEYACKVKEGVIDNPHYLPILYYAKEDEDWTDEKVWFKCNPALGDFLDLDSFRQEFAKAKEMPREEGEFRMYFLNQWINSAVRWLPMTHWKECKTNFLEKDLEGQPCYIGLDLASVSDFNAAVCYFPETGHILPYFWLPEDSITRFADYPNWKRNGHLYTTPGNTTDYKFIQKKINELANVFKIKKIAVDRCLANYLTTDLAGDGFDVVAFGQGFYSMSPPAKELERMVLNHTIKHNDNPVLTWMASNVTIEMNAAGDIKPIKPTKKKEGSKIDGIVALVMAVGASMPAKEDKNIIRGPAMAWV